ncbi:MAG: bifunctional 4-hydroxy-2-oxoglutarate aldolase/2-dehydro-3-deoxy-phosphogluconate aldolase [Terriglobales bacterium]
MNTMNKTDVLQRIHEVGLIPVVRAESAAMAHRAVAAVRNGGISIVEITMTVPGAIDVIKSLARESGTEALIGAGTVLDARTARECVQAGARFIVSPALDVHTIVCCTEMGIAVMAGALTPTEIYTAWSAGADLVKVFPAGAVGGPSYLKSIKGPLPHIKLVPTGGVSLKTAAAFIEAGAEALGVGADLIDTKVLKEGSDSIISDRARQYVEAVKLARMTK